MKKRSFRRGISAILAIVMLLSLIPAAVVAAPVTPEGISPASGSLVEPRLFDMDDFYEVWTTHGVNVRSGIPIGTGVLGALVWTQAVEGTATNAGTVGLNMRLSSADSWDANSRSINLTNVVIITEPNVFVPGQPIRQELDYARGRMIITAGGAAGVPEVEFILWGDRHNPTIHIEASTTGGEDIRITVEQRSWRRDRVLPFSTGFTGPNIETGVGYGNMSFAHVGDRWNIGRQWNPNPTIAHPDGGNFIIRERADINLPDRTHDIIFYQRNDDSVWDAAIRNQYTDIGPCRCDPACGGRDCTPTPPLVPMDQIHDPLTYRTMGAMIRGTGLVVDPAARTVMNNQVPGVPTWQLVTQAPRNNFYINITHNTAQEPNVQDWIDDLIAESDRVFTAATTDIETLRTAHEDWWTEFWGRSWMFIMSDVASESAPNPIATSAAASGTGLPGTNAGGLPASVTARGGIAWNLSWNHVWTRYLFAIQGYGENFIEMQGGLFGLDQLRADLQDIKNWHKYTLFNQRFTYWMMLQSGDTDMMHSFFDLLSNAVDVNRNRVYSWWGHEGMVLPEHLMVGGPWAGNQHGWNRNYRTADWNTRPDNTLNVLDPVAWQSPWPRDHINIIATRYLYAATPEFLAMMLDYYHFTECNDFLQDTVLPFAYYTIRFLDEHWDLCENGRIRMFPLWNGESDQGIRIPAITGYNNQTPGPGLTNTTHLVSNYRAVLYGLIALPPGTPGVSQADRDWWAEVLARTPDIPVDPIPENPEDEQFYHYAQEHPGVNVPGNNNMNPTERIRGFRVAEDHGWHAGSRLSNERNNQNLYPVFPLRLFSYGMPGLDIALESYHRRTGAMSATAFNGRNGATAANAWAHDNIQAAWLGERDRARIDTNAIFRNRPDVRWLGFTDGAGDGHIAVERNAIAMQAQQAMLVHPIRIDGEWSVNLLNAWPYQWSAEFRQALPGNNAIEGRHYAREKTYFMVEQPTTINYRLPWESGGVEIHALDASGNPVGAAITLTRSPYADDLFTFEATAGTVYRAQLVPVLVESVELSPATLTLAVGGPTATLTATVLPTYANDRSVTWASSNEAVATVSATGVVTAISSGTANITVTTNCGNFTATAVITVEFIDATGITVTPDEVSIRVDRSATLVAVVEPANASNRNVIWTSSDETVATVSEAGVVTGVSQGMVTITATTVDGGHIATANVTIRPAASMVPGIPVIEMNAVDASGGVVTIYEADAVQVTWADAPAHEVRTERVGNVINIINPAQVTNQNRVFFRLMSDQGGGVFTATPRQSASIDRFEGTLWAKEPGTFRVQAYTADVSITTGSIATFANIQVVKEIDVIFPDAGELERLTALTDTSGSPVNNAATDPSGRAFQSGNGTAARPNHQRGWWVFQDQFDTPGYLFNNNYEHNADVSFFGWSFDEPTVVNLMTFVPRNGANANRTFMGRLQGSNSPMTIGANGVVSAANAGAMEWVDLFINESLPVINDPGGVPRTPGIQQWNVKAVNPDGEAFTHYRWLPWFVPTPYRTLMNGIGGDGRTRANMNEMALFFHEFDDTPTAVNIVGAPAVLRRNQSTQLNVLFTPAYTTANNIIWSSNNPAAATVSQDGVVTARVATGVVVITARTADGQLVSSVTIRLSM